MSALCIAIATGLTALPLPSVRADFALTWTHSVERSEWREEWRADPPVLRLERAFVAGSGAGMEPPHGAVLEAGRWTWPGTVAVSHIEFPDTRFEAPVVLCIRHDCRPIRKWAAPTDSGAPVTLFAAMTPESCRLAPLALQIKE